MADNMTNETPEQKERAEKIEAAAAELDAAMMSVARCANELTAVEGFRFRESPDALWMPAVAVALEDWNELRALLVKWNDAGRRFLLVANGVAA